MDIFDKVGRGLGPIGAHAHFSHHYFTFPKLTGELGPRMMFNGKMMLNWSLNNYLGLGNHPEVREADAQAAADYGLAYPMGARMMSGNSDLHEEFEAQLAEFVGKEDSFVLNFGYQGVMSVVECMCDRNDVIVYDAEAHACLIDGIRLHKAKMGDYYKFNHNDMDSLRKNLERATKKVAETGGGILVITEGVFGMSGKVGSLDQIVKLKEEFNFRILLDDAHGFGTMGPTGAGVHEAFDVVDGIDLYFSTFAKSMASIGGFVAANKDIVMYLKYNMRSQIYAKALPMPFVVGGMKRLELMKKHPEFREKLWENVRALQKGLTARGFDIGETTSCVTPVFLQGDYELTHVIGLVQDLRENMGVFCSIVTYPVVPKGQIILRIIPTAVHTLEDVEYTMDCFQIVQQKLQDGVYRQLAEEFIAKQLELA